jgi:DNA-binding SARP family transcriptional activator
MTGYALKLLGGFELLKGVEAANLTTRKDRLLLAYLALNAGRPVTREKLASLLWADRGEEQARGSLRQALAAIRNALDGAGDATIVTSRESVTFAGGAVAVDASAFEAAARTDPARAIGLYRGPLLDGFDPASPDYAQWLLPERQRLENLAAELVEGLSQTKSSAETARQAISLARQLLTRDSIRESLWQALMRLLTTDNQKIEALKAYSQCSAALSAELGIKPSRQTEDLYRDIVTDQATPVSPSAGPAPAANARPSIAVMPFQNISRDPDLDRLCEGLAEEIISGLSRFKLFFVIDRYSSIKIAETLSDSKEIGEKLGVDLVVQGSLQRLAKELRITVNLVEAATRQQKWSGQYNCTEVDILAAPETITRAMIVRLNAQVEQTLLERSRRKPNFEAYEIFLQGLKHIRGYGTDDNQKAIECFDKAVATDPDFALAIAYRGFADIVLHGYDGTPRDIMIAALGRIRQAAEMDPDNPRIYWLMGVVLGYLGDGKAEEAAYRRSLELNPNDANCMVTLGTSISERDTEQGIALIREAMRLNPYHPDWYWVTLGRLLYTARRYEEAVDVLKMRRFDAVYALCRLAASLAQLGRYEEARETVAEVLKRRPHFRVSHFTSKYWGEEASRHFQEGLRKAGLPE